MSRTRLIAFYPELARMLGDVESAIYYQQLHYWSDKGDRDDGFIYKTKEEIEEETTLTRNQQDRIRKNLEDRGWLETRVIKIGDGTTVLHYRCLWEIGFSASKAAEGGALRKAGNQRSGKLETSVPTGKLETSVPSISHRLPETTASEPDGSRAKQPTFSEWMEGQGYYQEEFIEDEFAVTKWTSGSKVLSKGKVEQFERQYRRLYKPQEGAQEPRSELDQVFYLFRDHNPAWRSFKINRTERQAAEAMLERMDVPQVRSLLALAASLQGQKGAPQFQSPYLLNFNEGRIRGFKPSEQVTPASVAGMINLRDRKE